MRRKIWIDTDPGLDDALALAYLLDRKEVEIVGISTVAGNSDLETVTQNARTILDEMGVDLPLVQGLTSRNKGKIPYMVDGHRLTCGRFVTPKVLNEKASQSLKDMASHLFKMESVTILALGPLTNLASLFESYPELSKSINQLLIMGGCIETGNIGSRQEFNFAFDPEACQKVLSLPLPKVIVPLDLGKKYCCPVSRIMEVPVWKKIFPVIEGHMTAINNGNVPDSLKLFDWLSAYYLIKPELFELQACHIEVDNQGTNQIEWLSDLDADTYIVTGLKNNPFERIK